MIATITRQQIGTVERALQIFLKLGLVEVLDSGTFYMSTVSYTHLAEQPETSIGKYGRMRKSYLKEHRPILYNHLLMSEKLYPHLLEIERTAQGLSLIHI